MFCEVPFHLFFGKLLSIYLLVIFHCIYLPPSSSSTSSSYGSRELKKWGSNSAANAQQCIHLPLMHRRRGWIKPTLSCILIGCIQQGSELKFASGPALQVHQRGIPAGGGGRRRKKFGAEYNGRTKTFLRLNNGMQLGSKLGWSRKRKGRRRRRRGLEF